MIFFFGLGSSALWDRDETEYAQSVLEMQNADEWMIPTLDNHPFIEKPIMLFWVTRVSYLVFGANEGGARFPGALFGVLSCVAVYLIGCSLWTARTGFWSALILSTSLLFAGGHRLLLTDPFLVLFSLLSLLFYIYSRSAGRLKIVHMLISYFFIGLGVLSKGPIALFPAGIYIVTEWILRKNARERAGSIFTHLTLSILPVMVAAPWFVYSFEVQTDATTKFFLMDNLHRFLAASEGHTGPMFYHVLVLFAGFFPWSFFFIAWLAADWRNRSTQMFTQDFPSVILSVWTAVLFIFFSVSSHKLPHYMMPVIPAMALLTGNFFTNLDAKSTLSPVFARLTFVMSAALTAAAGSVYIFRPQYASIGLMIPFALLTAGCLVGWLFALRKSVFKQFASICAASSALFVSFALVGVPAVDRHRVMKPVALSIQRYASPQSKVYAYKIWQPSLYFYSRRIFPTVEDRTIDQLLSEPGSVFVAVKESEFQKEGVKQPYRLYDVLAGFAEDGGEMTLMLIGNGR